MVQPGILYIVATPIGNMGDISARARDVLGSVDLILSEDTRETFKLLKLLHIATPQISYRDQNHVRVVDHALNELVHGRNLALVSDNGTPLISDPGFKLVQVAIENKIEVVPIPGPTAIITALTASGLPTDKFVFLGFLPKNKTAIGKLLKEYGALEATLTIYESPYRIKGLLALIQETLGERTICVAKELTKKFEKYYRGTVGEVMDRFEKEKPRGEYVVMIAKEGYTYGRTDKKTRN